MPECSLGFQITFLDHFLGILNSLDLPRLVQKVFKTMVSEVILPEFEISFLQILFLLPGASYLISYIFLFTKLVRGFYYKQKIWKIYGQ